MKDPAPAMGGFRKTSGASAVCTYHDDSASACLDTENAMDIPVMKTKSATATCALYNYMVLQHLQTCFLNVFGMLWKLRNVLYKPHRGKPNKSSNCVHDLRTPGTRR